LKETKEKGERARMEEEAVKVEFLSLLLMLIAAKPTTKVV